ncbi:MAG: phage portal protein [Chloroflexi bacterium]|nr:phage portal protein [Chloroflexota bacterium]
MIDATERGTPGWWLVNLSKTLTSRRGMIQRFDDYYDGKHKLMFAGEKFREAFGGLFRELADNWMRVVVSAVEQRMNVVGFRFGEEIEADEDASAIWQRNNFDAESQLINTDALVTGYAYALVWVDDQERPKITGESPYQCIVAHKAGDRRERAAGLKQWIDDDGFGYAFVYTPDGIWRFRSDAPRRGRTGEWSPTAMANTWSAFSPDDEEFLANPTGTVPLVPFYNEPRLSKPGIGHSELANVIPIQDAINKHCADLLIAGEFGSFRQRWATGLELDRDEAGNKVNPFRNVPGGIWADENTDPPATFGEFGETNLKNIVEAIGMWVQHLASQSSTPPHYLNPGADRLSGSSIKAAETGLVAKTKRKFRYFGESYEEVMRLAFAMIGDERAEVADAETVWADPESRTESEHVDSLVKKKDLEVPWQQLMEDAGYTPPQIARMRAMRAQDALEGLLAAPPPAASGVPTSPVATNGQGAPVPAGIE